MLVNVRRTKNPDLKPAISAPESGSSASRLMALVSGVQIGLSFTAALLLESLVAAKTILLCGIGVVTTVKT
jgi:hypothetical protein